MLKKRYSVRSAILGLGTIDPGNQLAIAALSQMLEEKDCVWSRFEIARNLLKIDPNNQNAIASLFQIAENQQESWMCLGAVESLAQSSSHHQQAINTLRKLINVRGQDEYFFLSAVDTLLEIYPRNQYAIDDLMSIIEVKQNESILSYVVQKMVQFNLVSLLTKAQIEKVIDGLVFLIETEPKNKGNEDSKSSAASEPFYNSCLLNVAFSLINILQKENLQRVIISLRKYLNEQFYKNCPYRYEAVYQIIWYCTQNLSYLEFYEAWDKGARRCFGVDSNVDYSNN